jgi:hypothetical protein
MIYVARIPDQVICFRDVHVVLCLENRGNCNIPLISYQLG